jgi:hypothetical protein
MAELIAPITEDLRKEDLRMDVIKGIEFVKYKDEKLDASVTVTVEAGDWMVLNGSGVLVDPGASALANTYPVFVGNDQFDAQATGQLTLLLGGGFLYRTNKFVAGSYSVGQNLTIKGSDRTPQGASGGDPVLARVYKVPDAKGVMEIFVLDR